MIGRGFRLGRYALVIACGAALALPAAAADLYNRGGWSALASDRPAERVGDSLTVIIDQSSVASNSARNGSAKTTSVSGQISASPAYNRSAQLALAGDFSGSGQTGRADRMVAQISVVVDSILPNGDLHVSGEQTLNMNGEHIKIRIKGRLRRADISSNNTVPSTRLADASIDYDGAGLVSRGAKPGVVTRIFSWLGLL
ncbi:MAG: flagellar basal body L-ring protein FlgH [Phenylobacterium sp.]